MPASSGMIRTIRGGRDDARRFTPSGDIWTLRSARRADTTAATGTPITAMRMSIECSERSPSARGAPVNGTWYSSGRKAKKSAKPAATPAAAATTASTAETTET